MESLHRIVEEEFATLIERLQLRVVPMETSSFNETVILENDAILLGIDMDIREGLLTVKARCLRNPSTLGKLDSFVERYARGEVDVVQAMRSQGITLSRGEELRLVPGARRLAVRKIAEFVNTEQERIFPGCSP